jgi:alpha-D-xyloside xylohydrolase
MKVSRLWMVLLFPLVWGAMNPVHYVGIVKIHAKGEWVDVSVRTDPFNVVAEGDACVEQVEEGVIRYTSRSGKMIIPLKPGEAIYGLTERTVSNVWLSERLIHLTRPLMPGGLDRRGEKVTMWVQATYSLYSPFYISSHGYGMYVDGTWPGVYDIGKSRNDQLRIEWETGLGEELVCYFLYGPSYYDVLDKYTRLTGRPFIPPRWAFEHWRWRDEHHYGESAELDGVELNAELVEDIVMYEKLGIPAGVYMIDRPWAEGEFGYGNFSWDEERFPNPEKMLEALHRRGYEVIVWGAPWALGEGPGEFGGEARESGYIHPGSDRCLDYSNPAAASWHKKKIEEFMRRSGIHGWKLDRSEEYNPSGRNDIYHDGRTGWEVHNDYPRMYIKTYYNASRSVRGEDFVLMPRASYTGTQRHSIIWGGDIPGLEMGLRAAIIAVQRAAFMGYPVWGSDTGGYVEFTDREVFARWLEFSALCPLMEIGGKGSHAPWDMPKEPFYDEELIRIYRRYVKLHHSLIDYTYALAKQAHRTGSPVVRPLVFDHPDDPAVKDMWDEYKYGPDLLVAPVWRIGVRQREVYLPEGVWMDFWNREQLYTGPVTISCPAPLDAVPLFIRKGSKAKFPDPESLDE